MDFQMWPLIVAAGPTKPPNDTVQYQLDEMTFGVWEMQDAITEHLAPAIDRCVGSLRELLDASR